MDEVPIGRRVAYWRNRRRMSQQVFADRLGKSKSWVDKVERGVRRLDKFSVLREIADVLQLDSQILLGRDPARRPESVNCVDQVEIAEFRSALERYDKLNMFYFTTAEPPELTELEKAVSHAWQTFQHAKYGILTRTLPRLLHSAQLADHAYDGDGGLRAAHLLGQVYQIASSVLRKIGESDLSWLAADRAIAVAHRAGDELLAGVAACRVANSLVALGRFGPALEINVNMANRLTPGDGKPATPERLSVHGILMLQGAMAAARLGDSATVRELLHAAELAAAQLGDGLNYYWTSFSPTNVLFHRAAAAIEMGEGGRAVEIDTLISPDRFAEMMPERRAHHLLDLSRGLAQTGDMSVAAEKLVAADQLAPAEIRCRPIAHELVSDVLRRSRGAPPAQILELAEQMGVGV